MKIVDRENRICIESPPYEMGPPSGQMWTIYPDEHTYDEEQSFLRLEKMDYEDMFDDALQSEEE